MSHRRQPKPASKAGSDKGGLALYHVVYEKEGFDDAAEMLMTILRKAQKEHPDKPRHLYLDIDGHRNSQGGFDPDMYELLTHFVTGYLSRWLTTFSHPLINGKAITSQQFNDVPETLMIHRDVPAEGREGYLREQAQQAGQAVYDTETSEQVFADGRRVKMYIEHDPNTKQQI